MAEAKRAGLVRRELEVRLALGQVELRAGRAEAGRARLAALAQDAEAKGSRKNEAKARVVELRYFGGLTIEETTVMGSSPSTVKRA